MAGEITGLLEASFEATAAIIARRFVKLSGDQTVQQAGVAGEEVLGVAKTPIANPNSQGVNEVAAGKATAVQMLGIAWVEAGATINRGDNVMTDSVGRAITGTATNRQVGKCMKGATVGQLCLVFLTPFARVL
jgi:hypothetical protein